MFVASVVVRTSTSGDSPTTVSVSSNWPSASLHVHGGDEAGIELQRLPDHGAEPGERNVAVYSPPGSVVNR